MRRLMLRRVERKMLKRLNNEHNRLLSNKIERCVFQKNVDDILDEYLVFVRSLLRYHEISANTWYKYYERYVNVVKTYTDL